LACSTFDLFAIVQADRGRQGTNSGHWRSRGRHSDQHRALDDCRFWRGADVERDLIRTRTAEGRSRAKARAQHMGRPPKLTPQSSRKKPRRRRAEGATLKEPAKSYKTSANRRFRG